MLISVRSLTELVILRHFVISKLLLMHVGHKTERYCLHAWLEDVCKVFRHNSFYKWAVGATMVWHTSANKTPGYLVLLLCLVVPKLTVPVM
jgi:hypothetical protein